MTSLGKWILADITRSKFPRVLLVGYGCVEAVSSPNIVALYRLHRNVEIRTYGEKFLRDKEWALVFWRQFLTEKQGEKAGFDILSLGKGVLPATRLEYCHDTMVSQLFIWMWC